MSSRALRKLQREEEKRRQIRNLHKQEQDEEPEEEGPAPRALNAFDMLRPNEEDEEGEEEPEAQDDGEDEADLPTKTDHAPTASTEKPRPKKPKKRKTKKKGKEKDATGAEVVDASKKTNQLDEIDLALKSLSTKSGGSPIRLTASGSLIDPAHVRFFQLLAVESKHLNALNEMKRLFGNVVLEDGEDGTGTPRRRGRGPQQLDLGGALTARNSPVARGQGLAGLALRRNFLMQGKEEWPKAAGGGLSMELVEKLDDGTIEYRFVHNTIYQDTQRQFQSCVESMDPQRMISLLVYNPYHVSTLLQVSEIAKQQGDHSVSGDLLERALFTFGRSLNASFTNALSEGRARLNFERPENREFWLAAWRYMNNLGQRGTWRTAYEWAKLILSLDPELDPYCIHKVIDQLALRGGQPQHFLELSKCSSHFYNEEIWRHRPNIAISSALAEYRLNQPQECRDSLKRCIEIYPWIFARLFQELSLDHIPKSIWGATARTPRERLDCESYMANAKDLWNTPESTALLVEVASYATPAKSPLFDARPITLDETRQAVLSGIGSVINCIPREYTTRSTSSSDPFPPADDLPSYDPSPNAASINRYQAGSNSFLTDDDDEDDPPLPPSLNNLEVDPETAQGTDVRGLQSFFSRFIPWLGRAEAATGENDNSAAPAPSNEMEAAIAASAREAHDAGLPAAEIQERTNRVLEVLGRANQGDNTVPDRVGQNTRELIEILTDHARATDGETMSPRPIASANLSLEAQRQIIDIVRARDVAIAHGETEVAQTMRAQINAIATVAHAASPESAQDTPADPPRPHQASAEDAPEEPAPTPGEAPYDDERNQRWLAGQGMLRLKDYTRAHGTDKASWPHDGEGRELLLEYAQRVRQLQRERSRRFILDYALRQGAGTAAGELVEREIAGLNF